MAAFRRCLAASWEHKRLAYVADALVLLPGGLAFAGHPEDAARLMAFAVLHWQRRFGSFYRDLERDVTVTETLRGDVTARLTHAKLFAGVYWYDRKRL